VLIGGSFSAVGSVNIGVLARLRSNGSLDSSYAPYPAVVGSWIDAIAVQFDGKAIAAGRMMSPNGVLSVDIARLHADGSLDTSFNTGFGPSSYVTEITLDPAGDAVLGGYFTHYDGSARNHLTRIHATWPAAVPYCTAGVSANGCTPTMDFTGSPTISANSGFALTVAGLDGQRQGLVFYGVNGRKSDPWSPASTSFLCVKTPVQRMGLTTSNGTLGQCDGSLTYDWLAFVAAHPASLGAPFNPGVLVDAQCWFRDPAAPAGTNLSDALEFVTTP